MSGLMDLLDKLLRPRPQPIPIPIPVDNTRRRPPRR